MRSTSSAARAASSTSGTIPSPSSRPATSRPCRAAETRPIGQSGGRSGFAQEAARAGIPAISVGRVCWFSGSYADPGGSHPCRRRWAGNGEARRSQTGCWGVTPVTIGESRGLRSPPSWCGVTRVPRHARVARARPMPSGRARTTKPSPSRQGSTQAAPHPEGRRPNRRACGLWPVGCRRGRRRCLTYRSAGRFPHELIDYLLDPPDLIAIAATTLYGQPESAGLRIPDDMSLVTFDDLSEVWQSEPFLTVLAQPAYEIGRQSAELLFERLEGPARSTRRVIILPGELIVRRSSGPVPAPGPRPCEGS